MFSYRHAFHAGNHADVLKHTVLIATLQYLTEKDAALTVLDTHAGAGLYRLDGDYASTSAEASDGILRLVAPEVPPLTPALASSASACCAGMTSSSCLNSTPRTCVRWPGTWPSWKLAGK